MKIRKHIKLVAMLSISLAMAAVLAACGQASVPKPPAPPVESDIPDYIVIQGRQFSTELTELNLMRWMLEDYDLTPLRYMINLTSLDLNHSGISDLSPLAGLINLAELRLMDNRATDLSPLAGLTNLTKLELSIRNFDDTDLTPLIGLTNLTSFRLAFGGFDVHPVRDISRLADLTALTRLDLWHNQISDLTPLAGLTNLRHLDLSNNPISDISPLANLTNLNTLSLDGNPGIDVSLLYSIPPPVPAPAPAVVPANPHLLADALANFFVNLTTPGESFWHMLPYSYHAVLVDVDGRGTPGVVASRWYFDGDRHHPLALRSISIFPRFEQKLFFVYNNQLQTAEWHHWGVTPSGRLVRITMDGICDLLITTYTLLAIEDGQLAGIKSMSKSETTWLDNNFFVNYHADGLLWRNFEHDQHITQARFDELMHKYGLYGTRIRPWELPDDTYRILAMSAD